MRQSADPKEQVLANVIDEVEALKAQMADIKKTARIREANIWRAPDERSEIPNYVVFLDGTPVATVAAAGPRSPVKLAAEKIERYDIEDSSRWKVVPLSSKKDVPRET
jgi:hypothetical protein